MTSSAESFYSFVLTTKKQERTYQLSVPLEADLIEVDEVLTEFLQKIQEMSAGISSPKSVLMEIPMEDYLPVSSV